MSREMSRSEDPRGPATGRAVLRQLAEGTLPPAEFERLESALRDDAAARAEYVRYMDHEAGLYEEMSFRGEDLPRPAGDPHDGAAEGTARQRRMRWGQGLVALGTLAILIVAGLSRLPGRNEPTRFMEARLKGLEDAAVVTHASGIVQSPGDRPLVMGTRLKPGILELRQGEVQIDFLSGARVLLKAPAELHLLSSTAATLVSGSVGARVADGAEKFVLGTPDAAIVDLGTEFAVNVDRSGDSQVRVYDGEVEVSLLGEDGSTVFSQRLKEMETVKIDRSTRSVRAVDLPDSMFVTVREIDRSSLNVTPAYAASIREAKPFLYWRFEESPVDAATGERRLRNEAGDGPGGRIVVDPAEPEAIRIEDGAVRFSDARKSRYLVADAPLEKINEGAFTIELWLKSETFHWGSIASLVVPGFRGGGDKHMALIELAHGTKMVHKPSVVRFLHRHPPGGHNFGWNLFGRDTCMPGEWTYVVVVKEPDELRLYVNGALVRSIRGAETAGNDSDPYVFTMGQMGFHPTMRKFQGMVDELAIYRRALSPQEIREHYWTMMAGNGAKADEGPVARNASEGRGILPAQAASGSATPPSGRRGSGLTSMASASLR